MIRVVVDTNVLISALLKADSGPARIVTLWQAGELALVVSPETIDEVTRVLGYGKIRRRVSTSEAERFVALLRSATLLMNSVEGVSVVQDDPDDDKFLALAIAGGAEYIISGDKHLLRIGVYQNIQIMIPANFLNNVLTP